jgi:hypothetical protein
MSGSGGGLGEPPKFEYFPLSVAKGERDTGGEGFDRHIK